MCLNQEARKKKTIEHCFDELTLKQDQVPLKGSFFQFAQFSVSAIPVLGRF